MFLFPQKVHFAENSIKINIKTFFQLWENGQVLTTFPLWQTLFS